MNMRDLIPWTRGGGTNQGQSTFQAPSVFQNEGESPFSRCIAR